MKKSFKRFLVVAFTLVAAVLGIAASKMIISKAGSSDELKIVSFNTNEFGAVGAPSYIYADVEGGYAPYQYEFKSIDKDGNEKVIKDYTEANGTSWTVYKSGKYDLVVTVKDANNTTVSSTVKDFEVRGLEVTTINSDKESPCMVGDTVKLTFITKYEAPYRYNTNNFTIEKDGKSITTSGGFTRSYDWTPTEAGTYNITVYVADYVGQMASKTIEFTVNDNGSNDVTSANEVTIYYNGAPNTNIHYQIGDGEWTQVPGVAMTPCNDVDGYTHVYTIDLGEETTLNACFNDGNGNWDSKYGANYHFKAGTFYVTNYLISDCPL